MSGAAGVQACAPTALASQAQQADALAAALRAQALAQSRAMHAYRAGLVKRGKLLEARAVRHGIVIAQSAGPPIKLTA